MLSSVAERLYWLGRYVERAENTARLLNVYSTTLFDLPRGTHIGWQTLVDIIGGNEYFEENQLKSDERTVLRFLLADEKHPMSILSSLKMARENARTSREVLPAEAWEQINDLYLFAKEKAASGVNRGPRHDLLQDIIERCQQIVGLLAGTMSHDNAYHFISLARILERADMTTRIVDVGSVNLITSFNADQVKPYTNLLWMNVLFSLGAYQSYRQHVRNRVKGEDVVTYLLKDENFPRSVTYCLGRANDYVQQLPQNKKVARLVAGAQRMIKQGDIRELLANGLLEFIDDLQLSIASVHDQVSATWFLTDS